MNNHVHAIGNRLSLRQPQRTALEILARVCDSISLEKGADPVQALEAIRSQYPTVTDFEREFPSLCFALATGVDNEEIVESVDGNNDYSMNPEPLVRVTRTSLGERT